MLTAKQFKAADLNDMFEAGTLFEGLDKEKVVWICQERTQHPERKTEVAVFGLYYHNIEIGRMRGELLGDGSINWKDLG